MPVAPGMPAEFIWMNRDLNETSGGYCDRAETDGTGHIALSWQSPWGGHQSQFIFLDPASGSRVGSYGGVRLLLFGQVSGFMGANCGGGICEQNYVVLDPLGKELFSSVYTSQGIGSQASDPTGGLILPHIGNTSDKITILLDAIDVSGAVRWTQQLPDAFDQVDYQAVVIGVDRKRNVLVLWKSARRYGSGTWAGQWFDHAGKAGPVFQALGDGGFPAQFYERVGDGLFLRWFVPNTNVEQTGQFDAQATSMSPPPAWLAARPRETLHMVHDGRGYAVLPTPESSAACEQRVEVISPSGQLCGSSTFSMGGGACTTKSIIVGYDGTVVQQGPRERETCTASSHVCTCTYRYWPGYFR